MKHYIITIEEIHESPEGDILPFANEEHQLILSENEELLGVAMIYEGSEPKKVD